MNLSSQNVSDVKIQISLFKKCNYKYSGKDALENMQILALSAKFSLWFKKEKKNANLNKIPILFIAKFIGYPIENL